MCRAASQCGTLAASSVSKQGTTTAKGLFGRALHAGPVPLVDVLLGGAPCEAPLADRPGTLAAPESVRRASAGVPGFNQALGVDIFEELRVLDGGDLPPFAERERALERVAERADEAGRSGVVCGWVGGDQTVSLAALRGIHRAKLRSIGFVHIDAHTDTRVPSGRADSVVRVAVEEDLIRPDRAIQIGVRGPFASRGELDFPLHAGFDIATVDEVKWDLHAVVSQIRRIVAKGPVYVSVDVAALDPAFVPGASQLVPGGMNTWELQQLLRALVGAEILGFDVVSVVPALDRDGLTSAVAATALHEVLAAMADTNRSTRSPPSSAKPGRRGRRSA